MDQDGRGCSRDRSQTNRLSPEGELEKRCAKAGAFRKSIGRGKRERTVMANSARPGGGARYDLQGRSQRLVPFGVGHGGEK